MFEKKEEKLDEDEAVSAVRLIFSIPQPQPGAGPTAPAAPKAPSRAAEAVAHLAMIDHLLALDPGRRGIARFFVRGGAEAAARSLARAAARVLTTGFIVAAGQPETDGPPGTAVLGRALRLLGHKVTYVTDAVTVPALEASLDALGEPRDVVTFDGAPDEARAARRVLESESPTHLISIERPGRARDGDYRNARGVSVKAWNLPLDALFLAAPRRVVTVGIGDGGNEIGMGNVRARILRTRARFARHHLGGQGPPPRRRRHVELGRVGRRGRAVAARRPSTPSLGRRGASDGGGLRRGRRRRRARAGEREATVDGLPLAAHIGMLELLRLFVRAHAHWRRKAMTTTTTTSSVLDTYHALHPKSLRAVRAGPHRDPRRRHPRRPTSQAVPDLRRPRPGTAQVGRGRPRVHRLLDGARRAVPRSLPPGRGARHPGAGRARHASRRQPRAGGALGGADHHG